MPDTPTANYNWPIPAPTDPPNVPQDIGNLARAIDSTLKGIETSVVGSLASLIDTVDTHTHQIADLYTKVPTAKVKWGTAAVDFNASGHGTLTHAAGWVPSVAVLLAATPGEAMIVLNWRNDLAATAAALYLKGWFLNGTEHPAGEGTYLSRVYTGTCTVKYIIRD